MKKRKTFGYCMTIKYFQNHHQQLKNKKQTPKLKCLILRNGQKEPQKLTAAGSRRLRQSKGEHYSRSPRKELVFRSRKKVLSLTDAQKKSRIEQPEEKDIGAKKREEFLDEKFNLDDDDGMQSLEEEAIFFFSK